MLHANKLLSAILLLVITSFANGQESPSRVEYRQSPDLPNGIVFHSQLWILDFSNTRSGPAHAAGTVEQELGLNNVEAHNFVSQALTTLYFIDTDIRAQTTRIACEFSGPDVDKKDKYTAFQQMYDVRKAITDHYYEQTKASLDVETAERLQQWMDKRKLSMGYVETDYEKTDEQTGRNSAVTLSMMCGGAKNACRLINSNQ